MYTKFVFLILILCLDLVIGQSCNDCKSVTQCPQAIRLAKTNDNVAQGKLRNAFCGFKDGSPQVCCTDLGDDDIDNHPNLSLLPTDCGVLADDRLIGAHTAGIYEFPWMVLISHKTRDGLKFQCGGTLINQRYVLTAAHCIKNLIIAGVRIGEHDYRTATDCEGEPPKVICENNIQDLSIEESIIHPDYKGRPGVVINDIGLLRVKKLVDFTPKNAKPVCLPVTEDLRKRNVTGADATLAGWGITEEHVSSPILLTVNVPIHSPERCRGMYNRGKNPPPVDSTLNKLCAGKTGKDSCGGDSGGPMLLTGRHNGKLRYIQHGIVSYGPRQCGSEFPGVYTDVTRFMKWILDSIKP